MSDVGSKTDRLHYAVKTAKRPGVTRDLPYGPEDLQWVANSERSSTERTMPCWSTRYGTKHPLSPGALSSGQSKVTRRTSMGTETGWRTGEPSWLRI